MGIRWHVKPPHSCSHCTSNCCYSAPEGALFAERLPRGRGADRCHQFWRWMATLSRVTNYWMLPSSHRTHRPISCNLDRSRHLPTSPVAIVTRFRRTLVNRHDQTGSSYPIPGTITKLLARRFRLTDNCYSRHSSIACAILDSNSYCDSMLALLPTMFRSIQANWTTVHLPLTLPKRLLSRTRHRLARPSTCSNTPGAQSKDVVWLCCYNSSIVIFFLVVKVIHAKTTFLNTEKIKKILPTQVLQLFKNTWCNEIFLKVSNIWLKLLCYK